MSFVLDCSVTLSWYFTDERTTATEALLQSVAASGAVAPVLWRLEVANGLQMAVRRKRIDKAYRDVSLDDLAVLPVEIEFDSVTFKADIVRLADRHDLTIYDAVYLELALRRRLPLATLDKALRGAMRAANAQVLP